MNEPIGMSGWMAPLVPIRRIVNVLRLYLPGLEINIRKSVKLGQDNVNVVRSDTCGKNGNALSMVLSCDGNELS